MLRLLLREPKWIEELGRFNQMAYEISRGSDLSEFGLILGVNEGCWPRR